MHYGWIDGDARDCIYWPLSEFNVDAFCAARSFRPLECFLGSVWYLVKMHKPRFKLRKIEIDIRSPLANAGVFVAGILEQVVRKTSLDIVAWIPKRSSVISPSGRYILFRRLI